MIDSTELIKQRVRKALYTEESEDYTRSFDSMIHLPISYYIPWNVVCQINKLVTSLKYSDKVSFKKKEIERLLKPYGFRKFATGTNRMILQYVEDHTFLIKVALDRVGMKNNPDEFRNMELLKPFMPKTYDVTPCGTISMVERVQPITSRQEAVSIAPDIFDVIVNHILGKYVASDIGTKYYMNWGVRAGFGPVILDLTDLFPLDGTKLHCKRQMPDGSICNGEIDYDYGFNNLVCNKCNHVYEARELEKDMSHNENGIIVGGNINMSVELIVNGTIVARSNQTTESILPRASKRRRPSIDSSHINERKGAVLVIGDKEYSSSSDMVVVKKDNKRSSDNKEESKKVCNVSLVFGDGNTENVVTPTDNTDEKTHNCVSDQEVSEEKEYLNLDEVKTILNTDTDYNSENAEDNTEVSENPTVINNFKFVSFNECDEPRIIINDIKSKEEEIFEPLGNQYDSEGDESTESDKEIIDESENDEVNETSNDDVLENPDENVNDQSGDIKTASEVFNNISDEERDAFAKYAASMGNVGGSTNV